MNINLFNRQQSARQSVSNNEVITVNNNVMTTDEYVSKEQANADYVQANAARIRQKGYLDAGHASGDPIALECGLQEQKNAYLSWCHQHRALFTANMREAMNNLKQLLQQYKADLTVKEGERDRLNGQLADKEAELTRLNQRHYKIVEALKLMLALVGVVLGVFWVSYVYSNFFFDLSCTPQELKANGMFSDWGYRQGIMFAAVPLMLALFISLSSNRFKYVKALLAVAFVVMDVTFSFAVETRLVQMEHAFGNKAAAFDTVHFLMICCMAFLPAVALTSLLAWAKDMFYLDGIAEARGDKEKLLSAITALRKAISEVDTVIERLKAEIKDKTEDLFHFEGYNEELTVWYTKRIVRQISNLYYMGYSKFLMSMGEPDEETSTLTLRAECKNIYDLFIREAA